MTPTEQTLYSLTRFRMDDEVLIAGVLVGTVTGIKVTTSGEDEYRVFFWDGAGTPQEKWIRDSMLEDAGDEPPKSNVISFPCECEREAIAEARRATKH